jgi:hypothetical protein
MDSDKQRHWWNYDEWRGMTTDSDCDGRLRRWMATAIATSLDGNIWQMAMWRPRHYRAIHVRMFCSDGGRWHDGHNIVEWFMSTSFVVMACKKKKRFFFPSISCFFFTLEMETFTSSEISRRDFIRCYNWAHIRATSDHSHKHCICIHSTKGKIYDPSVKLVTYAQALLDDFQLPILGKCL